MKKLLTILCLLFAIGANGQKVYQTISLHGAQYKRLKVDTTLHLPILSTDTITDSILTPAIKVDSASTKLVLSTNGTNYNHIILDDRNILSDTATLDFPNTSGNTSSDLYITVSGAANGDPVSVGIPNTTFNTGGTFTATGSGVDSVRVRFSNPTGSAINPASGKFTFKVFK